MQKHLNSRNSTQYLFGYIFALFKAMIQRMVCSGLLCVVSGCCVCLTATVSGFTLQTVTSALSTPLLTQGPLSVVTVLQK